MDKTDIFFTGLIIGGILGILTLNCLIQSSPTAMDVYQGKTVLKYEMVGDVKVDSTVVFKEDY